MVNSANSEKTVTHLLLAGGLDSPRSSHRRRSTRHKSHISLHVKHQRALAASIIRPSLGECNFLDLEDRELAEERTIEGGRGGFVSDDDEVGFAGEGRVLCVVGYVARKTTISREIEG